MTSLVFAQNEPETAKPLTDMEVVRKVAFLDIEGKAYENVTISFKSVTPDFSFLTNIKSRLRLLIKRKINL